MTATVIFDDEITNVPEIEETLLINGYPVDSVEPFHTNITCDDMLQMLSSSTDFIIIDVREHDDYCGTAGHIEHALNFPYTSSVLANSYNTLSKKDPIIVVCQSGSRSRLAAEFLRINGFTDIYNLIGGMENWTGDTVNCEDSVINSPGEDDTTEPSGDDVNPDPDAMFPDDVSQVSHTDINTEEAMNMIRSTTSDITILDIREYEEYCSLPGHIVNALNYPYISGVLTEKYKELPPDGILLVVCNTGLRSHQAAMFLESQGFTNVYDITGGMKNWTGDTTPCDESVHTDDVPAHVGDDVQSEDESPAPEEEDNKNNGCFIDILFAL